MSGAGALRTKDIDPRHLAAMERGEANPRTLTESLAINHAAFLSAVLPGISDDTLMQLERASSLKAVARFQASAIILLDSMDEAAYRACAAHHADTARAIAVFMRAEAQHRSGGSLPDFIDELRGFAADPGFSVREWSWLAARPLLAAQLREALTELEAWTGDPDPYARRFPLVALRPRAMWSRHIRELKQQPDLMLPFLDALRLDPSPRVRRAVGNWAHDIARGDPAWGAALARRWIARGPDAPALRLVLRRALRGTGNWPIA